MATPEHTDFSSALTTWKDINLNALQKSLDASGLEIVENQKENMVGRKRLAEQTRDFKKIPDDGKLTAVKGLLKAYQSEIDALTKRSKTAESAFLSVYKLLAEAPDPYPLLDAAVDQTARASEAKVLESELGRSKDEIVQLKKEVTESKEKEKERKKQQERADKLEERMDEMVKAQVSNKESELNALFGERIANFQDRERDLTKQVEIARSQLRDLRTSNDSTQAKFFDDSSRREFETSARQAEMEMLQSDLERGHRRIEEMERRNEKLRAEIESVRNGSESQSKVNLLEAQVVELQNEATRCLENLEAQKESSERERAAMIKVGEQLKKRVNIAETDTKDLRAKVRQYSDYDEIKRELDVMKFVEFKTMSVDDDDDGAGSEEASTLSSNLRLPDPNADKANRNAGKSLESLLVGKNRRLQDDLTMLRVAHDELTVQSRKSSLDSEKQRTEMNKLKKLNQKLEEDLVGLKPGHTSSVTNGVTSSTTSTANADPLAALLESSLKPIQDDSTSTPRSTSPGPSSQLNNAQPSSSTPLKSSAETSILPIITSQRDRFRQRNAELEEELRKSFDAITETRNEMKSLQTDNLKLYEKVRYLQSYRETITSSSSPHHNHRTLTGSRSNGGLSSEVQRKDEELGKYRGIYEEHMNPFEKFRGRERLGALQSLNPFDKLVLHAANFILGNRVARNFFVLYACSIHALLFLCYTDSPVGGEAALHLPKPGT